MKNRSYSELIHIPSFEDRIKYLMLNGVVSDFTFGGYRYLNQSFYNSREWRNFRNFVITRDLGCDLAHPDFIIPDGEPIYIHHINPISPVDLIEASDLLMDPENTITTIFSTHNIIHYGRKDQRASPYVERCPGDTCPWKQ